MDLNSSINRLGLIKIFPDLKDDVNFRILSDCTPIYNCIAWAMGYEDRWVDIEQKPGHWWPDGVQRDLNPESLIEAFKAEGFELTSDFMPEDEYLKVVLYKNKHEEWTHAARIVSAEIEHSKFGAMWDGQHSHDVLDRVGEGCSFTYGVAYAYMKRKIEMPPSLLPTGKITLNQKGLNELKKLLRK